MDKGIFLAQFEGESKQAVIEYAKQITELQTDIIILMARKAACFYHTLETLGFVHNSAIITTDRVLGMDMKWMNGKKIAIIDELVFTGTTLKDSLALIKQKTVNTQVTCHALAVNSEHWESDYVQPDNKYFEIEDTTCRALSSSIVKSMSILPRPYSVDYPLYNRRSLYEHDISALSSCANWNIFDLTTKLQNDNNVRVFTLIPRPEKLNEFENVIGFKIKEENLTKIRIFGRYVGGKGGKTKFSFRVVPFFVFSPMYENQVDKLFNKLIQYVPESSEDLLKHFTTAKSKIRLLQYTVADKLAKLWLNDCNKLLSNNNKINLEHDDRELAFIFSPASINLVKRCLSSTSSLHEYTSCSTANSEYNEKELEKNDTELIESISDLQQALTQPFYDMYIQKEVPLQKLIKLHGSQEPYSSKNKIIKDRLKIGITIRELFKGVDKNDRQGINKDKLAFTLFLDSAIDQGIIVPITSKIETPSGNIITRSLRHGEEVKLSKKEFFLASIFLNSIKKNTQRNILYSTEMEKLLVLFLSCGANSQFLEEIFERTNKVASVGVKYYAFGAVSEIGTKGEKFEFDTSKSFSKALVREGIISEVKSTQGTYKINDTPDSYLEQFDPKKHTNSNIADTKALGQLISSGYQAGIFNRSAEDQTYLASCLYPENSILALAADINIFSDKWMSQFILDFQEHHSHGILVSPKIMDQLKGSLGYKALISGIGKFKAIEKKWPEKIFDKLKNAYCNNDETREAMWEKFWKSPDFNQGGPLPEIHQHMIRQLGIWLTHTRVCIDMIAYIIYAKSENIDRLADTESTVETQIKSLYKVSKRTHVFIELWTSIKNNTQKSKFAEYYSMLLNHIEILIKESFTLLNSAKSTVGQYGQAEHIEVFDDRLRVKIVGGLVTKTSSKEFESKFRKLIQETIEAARRPNNREPKKFLKGRNNNSAMHNRWLVESRPPYHNDSTIEAEIIAKGSNSTEWLIFLANKIIITFGSEFRVRLAIYVDFPREYRPFRIDRNNPNIINNAEELDISLDDELGIIEHNELVFISGKPNSNTLLRAHTYLEKLWKSKQRPTLDQTVTISNLVSQDLSIKKFVVGSINLGKKMNQVDIIILTILSEEFFAVKERLKNTEYVKDKNVTYSNMLLEGTLSDGAGIERKVLLCQSPEAGNTDMAITLSHVLNDYSCKVAILIGIAGGITSKLNIGDVIIADEVIYYEKQKDTETGNTSRMTSYRASRWTKNQISRLEVEIGKGKSKFALDSPSGNTFMVEKGPIGSGEKVLANSESEIIAKLKFTHDKTKAVEMEAAGLSMYMEAEASSKEPKVHHTIIIRGISDKADTAKSDDDQLVASQNAMSTLVELVKVADFSSLDSKRPANHI